jgi:menaquinone-dependent protoporphyrinogen oxidase
MRRILIVYGTGHGQTRKIAERIAAILTEAGNSVTVLDAGKVAPLPAPGGFDAVIVGSSVEFGRHRASVRRYVIDQVDQLNGVPSAFFSVSGSAASSDPAQRCNAREYLSDFLKSTGWKPWLGDTVAGAMAYTRYDPITRWVIRKISAKNGGPTDTSRDHEFTDWSQVDWFAEAFLEMVRPPSMAGVEVAI